MQPPEHRLKMLQSDAYCSICLKLSANIYEMHRVGPVTVCTQKRVKLLLLLVPLLAPVANIHIMALACSSHAVDLWNVTSWISFAFFFLIDSWNRTLSIKFRVFFGKKKKKTRRNVTVWPQPATQHHPATRSLPSRWNRGKT